MMNRKDLRKCAGKVIWHLRRKSGMTQMALAEKIGVSYQQLQKYEYGKTSLSLERLHLLAIEFGMKISEFVECIEVEQGNAE